jgi:phage terminase small subunit
VPVLANSKHERFAQAVVKGQSVTAAYISAGYAKAGAQSNGFRLMGNDGILSRIEEIKSPVADLVVACEISQRSWRVRQLQDMADDMLALRAARKILYADQMGEGPDPQGEQCG